MRLTYVAWNGEPYPWPPPDGWYQAVDGRWWAPGTGPEPDRGTGDARDRLDPGGAGPGQAPAQDQQTVLTAATRNTLPHYDEVTRSCAEDENERVLKGQTGRSSRGLGPIVWWVGGGAILLLLGAVGFLIADRSSRPDVVTAPTTTAVFGEALPPTTVPIANPAPTHQPPPTAPPMTSRTAETTLNPPTTTTVPDDDVLVAAWRADLADQNIDSSELSDIDIIDFGKSFCVFAVVSADPDEFDGFRDKAQTGVAGSLTESQLNSAINAAILRFCPDDAARLGITP